MKTMYRHQGEDFWARVVKAINSGPVSTDYATNPSQFITSTYKDGSTIIDDVDNGVPYSITFPEEETQ